MQSCHAEALYVVESGIIELDVFGIGPDGHRGAKCGLRHDGNARLPGGTIAPSDVYLCSQETLYKLLNYTGLIGRRYDVRMRDDIPSLSDGISCETEFVQITPRDPAEVALERQLINAVLLSRLVKP